MSIQSAALHKAVASVWNADQGLDSGFKQYWNTDDKTKFLSLNDGEAAPGTPFPYCVFEITSGPITTRMSGGRARKYAIRDIPVRFNVYASVIRSYSAKEYCAYLAEAVLAFFGGHPVIKPVVDSVTLDSGELLNFQFQNDYGMRVGDSEHHWVIEYLAKLDQPIAK